MLFICLLFGVTFGLQGRALGTDGDAAWNIRIGERILTDGLPRREFLLWPTYGQPTVYWEWLSQLFYGLAYRLAGLNGVVALASLLIAATGVGVYVALRQRGVPLVLAVALALAAIGLTSITWTSRAQLFSLALTLWWSEALWRYWRDGSARRLWPFPLIMALWVNLHGGFLGGFILLGTAVAVAWLFPHRHGKANPLHLTLALLASLAASLLTPWGPSLYTHIAAYASDPLVARYTQEYQSPDFHTLSALLFLALALLLAAAWIRANNLPHDPASLSPASQLRNSPEPLALAHAAIWTTLTLISVRFMPLWALIVVPLLAEALLIWCPQTPHSATSRWTHRAQRLEATDAQVAKGVWAALALLVLMATLANHGNIPTTVTCLANAQFDPHAFPVAAAQRLHAQGLPSGAGLTTYPWGGYLEYVLPEYHPFIDSRSDAYSEALLNDYANLMALAPGWRHILTRYAIRWALLPPDAPLTQALLLTPAWRCSPADNQGVALLCLTSSDGPHQSAAPPVWLPSA